MSAAVVPKRTPRVNVGREHTRSSEAVAALHDRCEKLQAENHRLKVERNEQEQLIKDLKTKFRRLTRDLKANGTDVDAILREKNPNVGVESTTVAKLAQITAQRDKFQSELNEARKLLRLKALPGSPEALSNQRLLDQHQQHNIYTSGVEQPLSAQDILNQQMKSARGYPSPHKGTSAGTNTSMPIGADPSLLQNALADVEALRGRLEDMERQNADLGSLNDQLQAQLAARPASSHSRPGTAGGSIYSSQHAPQSPQRHTAAQQHLESEVQRLREKVMKDAIELDTVTRERDMLRIQAQSKHNDPSHTAGVDPQTMIELQRSITEKTTQLTVLNNKFVNAQGQVRTLQSECDRLVEELRTMHAQNADVKRNMFEIENDKFQMKIKCDRVDDLEAQLNIKAQELMKCEQELLRMVDRMQSTARDTEASVRKECTARHAELEVMREEAESERRAKERENFALQQETNELRRHVDTLRADVEMHKSEIQRLQDEKQEMLQRNVLLGNTGLDVDDDVHKAVAMVGLKKKQKGDVDMQQLWEGLEWNDGWELTKMREAVAQAALDMELAETRCKQLQESADSKETLLKDISGERDTLLDENIELRQRISGIQTTFIKQQLEASKAASSTGDATASISVQVNRINCDTSLLRCDDGTEFSPTLFLTLDALEDYETVMSENFYTIDQELNVRFRFDQVPVSNATIEAFQRTNFTFQLHQSFGVESEIAAVGTLPAAQLLRCRDGTTLNTTVTLYDAQGLSIGTIDVAVDISSVFVSLLLSQPVSMGLMSAENVRAALLKFRGVRALRIGIKSAADLLSTNGTPSPYVYYTATSATSSFNFVSDTVVHSQNRAITADPLFESDAVEHKVVIDREFVAFVEDAVVHFVVFDHRADNVESNLGVAAVPLKQLLASPTETIMSTEKLHPQGTLAIEMSWVR